MERDSEMISIIYNGYNGDSVLKITNDVNGTNKYLLSNGNYSLMISESNFDNALNILQNYETIIRAYEEYNSGNMVEFYRYFNNRAVIIEHDDGMYYFVIDKLNGVYTHDDMVALLDHLLSKLGVI